MSKVQSTRSTHFRQPPQTGMPSIKDLLLAIESTRREIQEMRREMEGMAAAQNRMLHSRLNTLYPAKEVADLLGVSHATVLNWIREGKMPTTVGKKISGWDLEQFLQNHPKYAKTITGV